MNGTTLRSPFAADTWRALQIDPPPRPVNVAPGLFGNLGSAVVDFAPAAAGEVFRVFNRAVQDLSEQRLRSDQAQADDVMAEQILRRRVELELEAQKRDEAAREFVQRFTPDPAITGAASQVVYGFGKVLTKAVPAMMAAGPVGGAVIAGSLEGGVESLRLQDQGVDRETADRVGLATAAATTVGFALPIAGATWRATAALAVGGGPASFMSQQQAARMILDHADYSEIAQQYDPFDPVGLSVSTAASFMFGAGAMLARGRAAGKAPEPQPAPRVTPEQEAAARSVLLSEQASASGLHAADDLAASVRHVEALATAARQLDDAMPVDVRIDSDSVPAELADRLRALLEARRMDDLEGSAVNEAPPAGARSGADEIAGAMRQEAEAAAAAQRAPELQAARQAADLDPTLRVRMDEAGESVPARQTLDDAVREADEIRREVDAYRAAVECAMRN